MLLNIIKFRPLAVCVHGRPISLQTHKCEVLVLEKNLRHEGFKYHPTVGNHEAGSGVKAVQNISEKIAKKTLTGTL
ncbi:MAG: hypothetical protein DWC10_05900 [Candidatus Poseidoniales archaeon]|nr:MAG: hypothetical protein DWC10_05900 [Candidatus Poseidoniales archaeon]